ncbi:MAG: hypothetical protein AMXMBFR4_11090 [Candidatus Hydrogenedentota bacterium]
MNEELQRLCEQLEDEIERQENVQAVCRAQQEAVLSRDLPLMEARTEALGILLRECAQSQQERFSLVRALSSHYEIAASRCALSDLIDAAPDPWKSRLRGLQVRLRAVVAETRRAVRSNARAIRHSLGVTERLLDLMTLSAADQARSYDERGDGPARRGQLPALIDQKG